MLLLLFAIVYNEHTQSYSINSAKTIASFAAHSARCSVIGQQQQLWEEMAEKGPL